MKPVMILFIVAVLISQTAIAQNWVPQNSGTQNYLWGVAFTDRSNGWAVGNSGTILHTTDGGNSWTAQSSGTQNHLYSVAFANANSGWTVGIAGTVLHTTNGGTSWVAQSSGTTNALYGVDCSDANNAWAVGTYWTIVHTTNGGSNWVSQSAGGMNFFLGVTFTDASYGWATGISGMLSHTTNGGATWVAQSATTNPLSSVSFTDRSFGWAVGGSGTIMRTINGGTVWTAQISGVTTTLYGVAFTDRLNGWTVGQNGIILHSTTGGTNWVAQSSGTTSTVQSVTFADGNCGWAVGDGGTILHYSAPDVGTGFVELRQPGPPDWAYRLHHVSGTVARLVFTNFCPGTTGIVSGAAAAHWNMLAGGDGNDGDSVIFTANVPMTSGTLDVFWLSHPSCSDEIHWSAEDSSGTVDGPLPVALTSFEAIAGDNLVTLNWITASETDNHHFEIARDGIVMIQVPTQGNDATGHNYSWIDNSAINGTLYSYSLTSVDQSGLRENLRTVRATPNANAAVITAYALHQNFPNPFNPTTSITFDLLDIGFVALKVYNLAGQEVASPVNAVLPAGRHVVSFDASALSSGVYLYRLNVNGFSSAKKMLLVR